MAAILVWKETYSVGDDAIDAQHKQIVELINEMHAAVQRNAGPSALRPMLDHMVQYTMKHFKYEESLLQMHNYPELAMHQALHDKMRIRTLAFRDNIASLTPSDVLSFLKEWWHNHIQNEDKKYSACLLITAEF
jgi:hemerythrin